MHYSQYLMYEYVALQSVIKDSIAAENIKVMPVEVILTLENHVGVDSVEENTLETTLRHEFVLYCTVHSTEKNMLQVHSIRRKMTQRPGDN